MSVITLARSSMLPFWLLACLLASLLFAASAPSPLYSVYQALWEFPTSTLTLIYGVYAFGALAALLITGRVSDHVGRRRVTVVALIVQIAGMLAFVAAEGVEWLYGARILQGIGTGMAVGPISAWMLDLQPATSHASEVLSPALRCSPVSRSVGSVRASSWSTVPIHSISPSGC